MFAWVGKCKACGKDSIVRPANSVEGSNLGPPIVEIPNPERKSTVRCVECGEINEFYDNELRHLDTVQKR
jgi:hypothetical protein